MSTILALDQSSSHTGFAIVKDGKLTETGCINVPASQDLFARTCIMCEDIITLMDRCKPDFLCLEEIYGLPGRYTALKALAIVRGALIYVWWKRSGAYPLVIGCSSARAQLGIKGNAKKDEVMAAVNAKFNLKLINEHEADAVVIAVIGNELLEGAKQNAVPTMRAASVKTSSNTKKILKKMMKKGKK
jgi:Holliday junction resolvasome RuvABC endonuclease subunit